MPIQKKKVPLEEVEEWNRDDVNKWLISVSYCCYGMRGFVSFEPTHLKFEFLMLRNETECPYYLSVGMLVCFLILLLNGGRKTHIGSLLAACGFSHLAPKRLQACFDHSTHHNCSTRRLQMLQCMSTTTLVDTVKQTNKQTKMQVSSKVNMLLLACLLWGQFLPHPTFICADCCVFFSLLETVSKSIRGLAKSSIKT